MARIMKPAAGVHLFLLGDSGVLFDEPAQKLFHLDTYATFIWCQLESDLDEQAILLELQTVLSISPAEADANLASCFTLFKNLGVLRGFEKTPEKSDVDSQENKKPLRCDDAAFISQRHYYLLSTSFRVRFSTTKQLELVDPVLSHLQHAASMSSNMSSNLSSNSHFDIIQDENGRIHICQNNLSVLSCALDEQIAPLVKSLLWQTAVNEHDYFLNIHGGVVSDGNHCLLFPAGSGSGKSTLVAALVCSGFDYFSDEAALLQEPEFCVESVPLAICIKSTGIDVLRDYYPNLPALPEHHRSDGKKVRYLSPISKHANYAPTPLPVAAIILPRYSKEQPTALEKVSSIEALQGLMQECLIVNKPLNKDNVARLLTWVENTPSYRLTVGKLEVALELIKDLAKRLGSA